MKVHLKPLPVALLPSGPSLVKRRHALERFRVTIRRVTLLEWLCCWRRGVSFEVIRHERGSWLRHDPTGGTKGVPVEDRVARACEAEREAIRAECSA